MVPLVITFLIGDSDNGGDLEFVLSVPEVEDNIIPSS